MAPKRILEDPPAASSMEEEEDSDPTEGEEEEEEAANDVFGPEHDDDDEEEEKVNKKKEQPKPVAGVPIAQAESSSDDEDDDGSETESDDDDGIVDFTVKPIVSKPNNTTDSAKPSAKKPVAATPTKAPKRAAETDLASKDSKKKKKKKKGSGGSGGDDEDTKKGRLWSEEDEIAILKGMIDYKAKKGLDPSANLGPFHEFLKKTLKVDVSKNQLADKMRRLKKKYLTNAEKSENGEDPVFSKAHETKSFDLSKKIWGVEANGADDSAKNSKKKQPRKTANANANSSATVLALPVSDASEKKVDVEKKVEVNVANGGVKVVKAELEDFSVKYPHLSGSLKGGLSEGVERLIFENLPAFGSSKVKDLDAKWKKLQLLELELAVKKFDLMHEQSKLVMDAVKSWKD